MAPTSVLTFEDLILEVARKLGIAYYGDNGDEVAQVPVDGRDLDECERHVNNALRMFINDAPVPNGWRWTRPVQSINLWTPIAQENSPQVATAVHDPGLDKTTITVPGETFFASMEERPIEFESAGTFTISTVVSGTELRVRGDASAAVGDTFAIETRGDFTLPRDFGGQFIGDITYEADTNRGVGIEFTTEREIRQWRENLTVETGTPFWAAIRQMNVGQPRRRWELMLYPQPDEPFTVEFSYHLHFDKLVELDEVHPAPFGMDEAVRAACLAVAEKDDDDTPGHDWQYYREIALPNAHRVDAQSAPPKLGYFYNPGSASGPASISRFRQQMYQRPNVTFLP